MRYLLITYYQKANGQFDETIAVTRNLKTRDIQICSVILDFKKLQVVKCRMNGTQVPKDWEHIVTYYNQHYANIIERLFNENGYEVVKPESTNPVNE